MSGWFLNRTAEEWFADVLRWYMEEHQGCPCCQGRHCVFRAEWGTRIEYYCTSCDFYAGHDRQLNRCTVGGGDNPPDLDWLTEVDRPLDIRPTRS
jgi:hypothetical protein